MRCLVRTSICARNGLVDDGLLLLLQQRDQLLLGADVAPDAPVGVVEEADDGGLFGERGEWGGAPKNASSQADRATMT